MIDFAYYYHAISKNTVYNRKLIINSDVSIVLIGCIVRTIRLFFTTIFVNRSYRSYDIGRTTDVVSYVPPTFVNSTKGAQSFLSYGLRAHWVHLNMQSAFCLRYLIIFHSVSYLRYFWLCTMSLLFIQLYIVARLGSFWLKFRIQLTRHLLLSESSNECCICRFIAVKYR